MINIYVGNLSFDASEVDLETAFSQFGEVQSVNIITDRETGRSRGFGFIEMRDHEAGKQAIEQLNLQEIAGRAVIVNEARPREERRGGGRRPPSLLTDLPIVSRILPELRQTYSGREAANWFIRSTTVCTITSPPPGWIRELTVS